MPLQINNLSEEHDRLWELCQQALLVERHQFLKKIKKAQTPKELSMIESEITAAVYRRKSRSQHKPEIIYPDLPIIQKKEEIINHLKMYRAIVVCASTGSGKSTQLAKFCLDAGLGEYGKIACIQPRRLAAISLAKRVAEELGENIGESVDYHIRFDDKSSPHSFIRFMTDGMLLAKLQQDPFLWEYRVIIIDEVHERSLNIDLLLGLLFLLQNKRPDLKVILASATLDAEKFCRTWQAPLVHLETALFPIQIHYHPPQKDQDLISTTISVIEEILSTSQSGDILVFMPSEEDIHQTTRACETLISKEQLNIFPLYARLGQSEQQKIFRSCFGRKIIISTNIAETSLTIDGICYVIDSGLARISQYSSVTHLQSLPILPISQSSANQRKGRCGRTQAGICYRLYSQEDFNLRPEFSTPEIQRSNLTDALLRMLSLGITDLPAFPFPDPPQKRYFHHALIILHELRAVTCVDRPRLTKLGRILAHLPLDPRLGRILLAACDEGCLQEAIIIVAGLASQEIKERPKLKESHADQKHALLMQKSSDFLFFLHLYQQVTRLQKESNRALKKFASDHFLSYPRLREWLSLVIQLTHTMKERGYPLSSIGDRPITAALKPLQFSDAYASLHRALLYGYARQTCQLLPIKTKNKMEKPSFGYQNINARDIKIIKGSALSKEQYPWIFTAIPLQTKQLFARMNAAIDLEWLIEVAQPFLRYRAENGYYSLKDGEVLCQYRGYLGQFLIDKGKRVALHPHDPKLAKELFIRSVFLAEKLDFDRMELYPFWQKNTALKQDIESLETRLRQQSFYAGEEALYQFYDIHLPELSSWVTLDAYIRTQGDEKLCCKKEDLLARPITFNEEDFPLSYFLHEKNYSIAYAFEPGKKHDGCTVQLYADEIDQIDPAQAAWGIGGLFKEKIEKIIRQLPKADRIKLHPITDRAQYIDAHIDRSGSMYEQLSIFCKSHFDVFISPQSWQTAESKIPEYLRMRFAIIDHEGKELFATRNISDLKKARMPATPTIFLDAIKKKYTREDLCDWPDFDIPTSVPIEHKGKKIGVCYPCLFVEEGKISVQVLSEKNAAFIHHDSGVQALILKKYHKEIMGIKKSLQTDSQEKIFSYYGGTRRFDQLLWQGILTRYFKPSVRTREAWQTYSAAWIRSQAQAIAQEKNFMIMALHLYVEIQEMLANFMIKHSHLKRLWQQQQQVVESVAGQQILPQLSIALIHFLPTYLRAIQLRCQRAIGNPSKDRDKAQSIEHIETEVQKRCTLSFANHTTVQLLWQQLQVKTFAPELLPHTRVSAESLTKILNEDS
ncbi:MAG: ATP-dependent RNA helicase HrpA [Spirochaetia bacterium]